MKKSAPAGRVADNRSARFHYEILETFLAGIALTGSEAKACRTAHPNLRGAFVSIQHGEAILRNLFIPEYKFAKGQPHVPRRDRKLLLNKKELGKLEKILATKGVTAFPLDLHFAGPYLKVTLGVGRGKKKWDKRETIKKRDLERETRRGA